jgi:phosphopantothenoylcysteine decarboxylase/phosphopantothenate--cysteine ligase
VLVTAGPTREALDPVRYVGNRSSGRMGYALAQAAWRRGAEVTLVSGPSSLDAPVGVELVRVQSAREMLDAVAAAIPAADVTVFAAAVADFKPAAAEPEKVKREKRAEGFAVELSPNPDIAADTRALRKAGSVTVGFALETTDVLANARKKLEKKGFDFLVANDVTEEGAGFDVETNRVTILMGGAGPEALPLMSKDAVAEEILDRAGRLLAAS